MKRFLTLGFATIVLSACGGGGSSGNAQFPTPSAGNPPSTDIEIIHASQNAPDVNVVVGTSTVASGLAFGEAAYTSVTSGTFPVEVQGILPGGVTASVIGPVDLNTQDGERVTIIAANDVANIAPIVLTDDQPDVAATDVRARVVHAASTAPMVDVYVAAPGVDITTIAPLGTFSFGETLGPVTVAEGDYQITVTPAGDPATVAYDSGTVTLTGGSDLVIAALSNVATGSAAIELLASTGAATLRLLDTNAPADLRVVHASSDAPNVDVIANDDFVTPAVADLAFPDVTDYLSLAPGMLNVKVVPTGATTPVVIDADLTLNAGESITVIAADTLANIQPLVLVDDVRAIGTEARLRLIHGSTLAGNVDIYVVAPGTDVAAATPNFTDVPFLAETGFVSLDAGDYEVVITATGDSTPAIGPLPVSLNAGEIYTAIARDGVGATTPLDVILLDDFL